MSKTRSYRDFFCYLLVKLTKVNQLHELKDFNELEASRGGVARVEILQMVYEQEIISQLLGIPCNFCVSYI